MAPLPDKLTVGSRVIVAQEAELRGTISIGSGTVIHPRCTILAVQGPISIGSNCIIEETCVLVNRSREKMSIGDDNLFEVGCRIESPHIGNHNTFEPKCRTASNLRIGNFCTVGAGCYLTATPTYPDDAASILASSASLSSTAPANSEADLDAEVSATARALSGASLKEPTAAPPEEGEEFETLPDQSVVWGPASATRRRIWSGEGVRQQQALHAKHLEYLRESIPKFHKLRLIQ